MLIDIIKCLRVILNHMKNINVYIGDGAGHAIPSNTAGVTDFEEHAPNRHSGNMTNMSSGDRETDVPG